MTNEEKKANDLIVKYTSFGCGVFYENEDGYPCITKQNMIINSAARCAIIAVDLVCEQMDEDGLDTDFWLGVKIELEKKI